MFKDKMCKTTVAPSNGLRTTLNNVVYFVIYVIVYRIRLVKFRSNIKL